MIISLRADWSAADNFFVSSILATALSFFKKDFRYTSVSAWLSLNNPFDPISSYELIFLMLALIRDATKDKSPKYTGSFITSLKCSTTNSFELLSTICINFLRFVMYCSFLLLLLSVFLLANSIHASLLLFLA